MFLLGNIDRFTDGADVQIALAAGLATYLSAPAGVVPVSVQGQMPQLELIQVDLSSAQVDPTALQRAPVPPVTLQDQLGVAQFHLVARPLHLASATVTELGLEARAAALEMVTDARNTRWLRLVRAAQGRVLLDLGPGQLERMLLDAGRDAAAQQGARLEQVKLNLTQTEERAVRFETEISGRKAFLRGTIMLGGEMRFDGSLNVQLNRLTCTGQGALGKMAASWLRSTLTQWEGKTFSPLGNLLQEVKCHQARLVVGEGNALRAEAEFATELRTA